MLILELLRIFIDERLRSLGIGGTAKIRLSPPSKIEVFSKSIEPANDVVLIYRPHTCIPNLFPLFNDNGTVVLRTNGGTVVEE